MVKLKGFVILIPRRPDSCSPQKDYQLPRAQNTMENIVPVKNEPLRFKVRMVYFIWNKNLDCTSVRQGFFPGSLPSNVTGQCFAFFNDTAVVHGGIEAHHLNPMAGGQTMR